MKTQAPRRTSEHTLFYRLEVTLRKSQPLIWRRFQVPATITLAQLHTILQVVMGWTDSHLHRFIINGKEYGRPDYEERYADDDQIFDERRVRIEKLFPVVPAAFLYEYDYGDSWLHVIIVEGILSGGPDTEYPKCIEGERACPPEDVGGIWGYEELLVALADQEHEDHEMMRLWAGADFDPEVFDIEAINYALRHL